MLGTQDEEVTRRAAVSKVGTEILQESGTAASHDVLCATSDVFRMVDTSRKSGIVWRSSGQSVAGFEEDASVWETAPSVDVQAAHLQSLKTSQRTRRRGDESSCSIDVKIELSKAYSRGTQMAKAQHQRRSGVAALAAEVTLKFVTAVMLF